MRNYQDWLHIRRKLQIHEAVRARRERTETKRWERFLRDREAFDEGLEHTLDVYEIMMRNQDGCGW